MGYRFFRLAGDDDPLKMMIGAPLQLARAHRSCKLLLPQGFQKKAGEIPYPALMMAPKLVVFAEQL